MNDRIEHPVETPGEWLRYAEGDLGVAERELCYQEPAYHTICFLYQSAAEKFLKGDCPGVDVGKDARRCPAYWIMRGL